MLSELEAYGSLGVRVDNIQRKDKVAYSCFVLFVVPIFTMGLLVITITITLFFIMLSNLILPLLSSRYSYVDIVISEGK